MDEIARRPLTTHFTFYSVLMLGPKTLNLLGAFRALEKQPTTLRTIPGHATTTHHGRNDHAGLQEIREDPPSIHNKPVSHALLPSAMSRSTLVERRKCGKQLPATPRSTPLLGPPTISCSRVQDNTTNCVTRNGNMPPVSSKSKHQSGHTLRLRTKRRMPR